MEDKDSDIAYELIEENVTDVEWHSRRTRIRRNILIVIIISVIIIGIILASYILKYAHNKPISSNDSMKCPLSPAYPQLGGSGCSESCPNNTYSSALNFEYQWPSHFTSQIHNASIEMQHYINNLGLNASKSILQIDESDWTVHLTVNYFCCLTHDQLTKANNIIENYEWPAMEISFEKVVCFDDGSWDLKRYPNNTWIEIVVYANNISQTILLGAVTEFEQTLIDAEIPINVPRRKNVGFHVTVGMVNGTEINVLQLVEKLNDIIHWNDQLITMNSLKICTEKKNPIGDVNYSCLTS